MTDTHHDYAAGPHVTQTDYQPDRAEWPLVEPDRSDDREQVIYEGHRGQAVAECDWCGRPENVCAADLCGWQLELAKED